MPVTTSRQRVLNYLQKHRTATAAEIARDLGMTTANARHHLARLQADGRIQQIDQRHTSRRGRPEKVYTLAAHQLGDNLPELVVHALRRLEALSPSPPVAHALAASMLPGVQPPAGMTPRLNALTNWLNQRHYHARWEAHADGPRVIFAHCPYRALLDEWPAICQLDAQLLTTFLGAEVTQTARLEPSSRGLPQCVFFVRPTAVV